MNKLTTPGVYLVEKNAFSSSVRPVPTAVPAFIGYTERAVRDRVSLVGQTVRINSLAEYIRLFGKASKTTFKIKENQEVGFTLTPNKDTQYNLYNSLRLFYANGGGSCYITSAGTYGNEIKATELRKGLSQLLRHQEPTMVVVPDAVLLNREECYGLYQDVIQHCGVEMRDRFAILDVHDGFKDRSNDKNDVVSAFRDGIGSNSLAFGAGYYPWVNTTITSTSEVSFKNISNIDGLIKVLVNEAEQFYLGGSTTPEAKPLDPKAKKPAAAPMGKAVDAKMKKKFEAVKAEIEKLKDDSVDMVTLSQTLKAISPTFKSVLKEARRQMNILPPSGAIAGVYSLVDNMVGVHKAPANVSLSSVVSPCVDITSDDQEDLNVPLNGKSVNAIRGFMGKGVLVWGARTLDGNSDDWRYISVRRTVNMIEESIKNSVEAFVFEQNDSQTWIKVKTSIDNFLTNVWKAGSLSGTSPSEAYDVNVGLGNTMTPQDVLDGVMRISVRVAISRPAEFIVINFEQKLQEAAAGGDEEGGGEEDASAN